MSSDRYAYLFNVMSKREKAVSGVCVCVCVCARGAERGVSELSLKGAPLSSDLMKKKNITACIHTHQKIR
jgi:hypothetical protein